MLKFIKSPFSFEGRIGRFSFFTTNLIWNTVLLTMIKLMFSMTSGAIFFLIVSVISLMILVENAVGRCNDIRCSKWWLLLLLIPLGPLVLIFFPGEKGPNKHGEPPK